MELILPLDSPQAVLGTCGGKGANLARLAAASFNVPPGFIVTTAGYRLFVEENHLQAGIAQAVSSLNIDDQDGWQAASSAIRERFQQGRIPPQLAVEVKRSYAPLDSAPVAVRSSATAEDLPSLSFAGQQDTYLNVRGEAALFSAIIDCFSSLWTARAIGYRLRNAIEQESVLMAVVVQEMVASEAAGVLFTANPLTGRRNETVIDAVFGLGEALVSGQTEPDQYVVDTTTGEIRHRQLGAKAMALVPAGEGGVRRVGLDAGTKQVLPDSTILELTELGRTIAELFEGPQDIEWAWAGNALFLLQSRSITSLFPLPATLSADPLQLFFSFAAVQGVTEPITPLGRDTIKAAAAGAGRRGMGFQGTLDTQTVFVDAAERLWLNLTPVVNNRIGRHVLYRFTIMTEAGTRVALTELFTRPELRDGIPRPRTIYRLVRFLAPTLVAVLRVLISPAKRREIHLQRVEAVYSRFVEQAKKAKSLSEVLALHQSMSDIALLTAFRQYVPLFLTGNACLALLHRLGQVLPGGESLALSATRGLPHNVTTEMDLALWHVATVIQSEADAAELFTSGDIDELVIRYKQTTLPPATQQALEEFFERYGMRGIGEIDLGNSRWREMPEQIFRSLQSYLLIDNPERTPDAVFARGKVEAEAALAALAAGLRKTRLGRLKAWLVRRAGERMRELAGYRESPKFLIIRMMGHIRERLLAVSDSYVAAGQWPATSDIFLLRLSELHDLQQGQERKWSELIAGRRKARAEEMLRRRIPTLLLGDGTAYYEGSGSSGADLTGTPVSPGVVEGVVRVVLQPRGAHLKPGEILVCAGTDPAWTPLFLAAGGLVTEVGGLMTHGSVVAREYGIPAVVGVREATTRLASGQRIRLDGSSGQIVVLEEEPGTDLRTAAPQPIPPPADQPDSAEP